MQSIPSDSGEPDSANEHLIKSSGSPKRNLVIRYPELLYCRQIADECRHQRVAMWDLLMSRFRREPGKGKI